MFIGWREPNKNGNLKLNAKNQIEATSAERENQEFSNRIDGIDHQKAKKLPERYNHTNFDEPLSNRRNFDEQSNNHLHFAEPVSLQEKLDVENAATLLSTHKKLEGENQKNGLLLNLTELIIQNRKRGGDHDHCLSKVLSTHRKFNEENDRRFKFIERFLNPRQLSYGGSQSQKFADPRIRHWKIVAKKNHSLGFVAPGATNTKSDGGYGHDLNFSKPISRHRLSAKEKYYRTKFQKSHSSYNKLNEKNELFTETHPIRQKLDDVKNQHPNFVEPLLGHGYAHESEDQPKVSSMIPFTHPKLDKNSMHHANIVESQLQYGKLHQRKTPMHGLVGKNNGLYLSFNKSFAGYEKYDEDSNKDPKHTQSALSNKEEQNINHHRSFADNFSIDKNSVKKSSHLLWLDQLISANHNRNRRKDHRLYLVKPFPNYKNFRGRKIHRSWHFVSLFKANKIFVDGNDSLQKTNMSPTTQEKPESLNNRHYHLDNLSSPHQNVTRELLHPISTHRKRDSKIAKATSPHLKKVNLGKVHAKFRALITALSKDNKHNMSRKGFAKKAWVIAAADNFYQNDKDDTTSEQSMIPVGYLWDYFKKFYSDDNQNEYEVVDGPESYGKLETTDSDITSDEPNTHEYNGRYIINSFSDNRKGINDETRYHKHLDRKFENEQLDPSTEDEADDYNDEDYDSYDNNDQRYELPVSLYDDEGDNESYYEKPASYQHQDDETYITANPFEQNNRPTYIDSGKLRLRKKHIIPLT